MSLYSKMILCLLSVCTGHSALLGMDGGQGTQNSPQSPKRYTLTDRQRCHAVFYTAICEGDLDLVRSMVMADVVNPHEEIVCFFPSKPGQATNLPLLLKGDASITDKEFRDNYKKLASLPLAMAAHHNQVKIVQFFIEECNVDINTTYAEGISTPLHIATRLCHVALVKYLLDHYAHPHYHNATQHPETVPEYITSRLAQNTLEPEIRTKLTQIQLLVQEALRTKLYPTLTTYWSKKHSGELACLDLREVQVAQTCFYQALCAGDLSLVKTMINDEMIDPSEPLECHYISAPDKTKGKKSYIPLTNQTIRDNPESGDFANSTFFALNTAIRENQSAIIKFLVEDCRVDVNACSDEDTTSLHTALVYLNSEIISYLIDHGANPLYKDNSSHGHTVLASINWWLLQPDKLGPDLIAKLEKIKPIIEQALITHHYPDPYAKRESSESSEPDDSDEDTDDDQILVAVAPGSTQTVPLPPSRTSSANTRALGVASSATNNNTVVTDHPDFMISPPVSNTTAGNRPTLHTRVQPTHSWRAPLCSILGIAVGIVGIKLIYNWYTGEHEVNEAEAEIAESNTLDEGNND